MTKELEKLREKQQILSGLKQACREAKIEESRMGKGFFRAHHQNSYNV